MIIMNYLTAKSNKICREKLKLYIKYSKVSEKLFVLILNLPAEKFSQIQILVLGKLKF